MIQHNIRIQMTLKPLKSFIQYNIRMMTPMFHNTVKYPHIDDPETQMIHDTVQYPDTSDHGTPMIHYIVQYLDTDDPETP